MSDARWRKKILEMTKAEKMRAAKRAKSLGDEELEQSSNQQTTPEVPEDHPEEFGQGNQQATSKVYEEQSQAFLISLVQLLKVRWKRTLQLETVEVMMKRLLLVKRKI